MTAAALGQLAVDTIRTPREVARRLMDLKLPRDALWTALALVVVLNAALYSASNMIAPPPDDLAVPIVAPVPFALFLAAGLVGTIYALWYVGRMLGGEGALGDIMVLLVWLQALRLVVQAALLVLVPLSPVLSSLVVLAAAAIGFWILLNFIDVAHGYGNLLKSLGALALSVLAMALGLTFLVTLFGGALAPT
ncbi:MAG: YIP1 family protein [Rhodosalinus sp.]|uniref:YIP1 family protein n=1 Tax=Rhodosalinus sp. TaxID=2047741 RepID=UPI00397D1C67